MEWGWGGAVERGIMRDGMGGGGEGNYKGWNGGEGEMGIIGDGMGEGERGIVRD